MQWTPWPRPFSGALTTSILAPGLPTLCAGDTVGVIASSRAGFLLVARCPEHADCDGLHVSPAAPCAVYVVPAGAVSAKPTALERHVRALSVAIVHKGPASSVSAVAVRVDRVHRGWRAQLRGARLLFDAAATVELFNQVSQLAEWRRQEGGGALGASSDLVRDSILQLADGTAQQSVRVVAPRTEADELASESNTAPLRLLELHAETEGRLQRGKHVPSHAAEALALAVAQGQHGGAAESNDEATDVGGLGAVADETRLAPSGGRGGPPAPDAPPSPLEQTLLLLRGGGGADAPPVRDDPKRAALPGLLHLVVDLDVDAALAGYGQPVSTRVWVHDAPGNARVSEVAVFEWLPQLLGAAEAPEGSEQQQQFQQPPRRQARWSRAVFLHMPAALIQAGGCFVVVQLFRLGPLRDDAGGAPRSRASAALYSRPLGTAVLAVPAVLARLPDATPHRPLPLELQRPATGEDRWPDVHRAIIAEMERDALQRGRRAKQLGAGLLAVATGGVSDLSAKAGARYDDVALSAAGGVCPLPVVVRALLSRPATAGPTAPPTALDATVLDACQCVRPAVTSWEPPRDASGAEEGQRRSDPLAAPEAPPPLRERGGRRVVLVSPGLPDPGIGPQPPPAFSGRDELYVTVLGGAFSQGAKLSALNVQLRVAAILDSGELLPCLWRGRPGVTPDGPATELRSAVHYHDNAPAFDDAITVSIPAHVQFERAHLLFSVWHASTTETKTHCIAFAFLPLAGTDGTCIRDGRHVLRTYRPPAGGLGSGARAPLYLVAPVVGSASGGSGGGEVLPGCPMPVGAAAAAYDEAHAPSPSAAAVRGGSLLPSHATASRLRNLPLSAVPAPLNPEHVPDSPEAIQAVFRRHVRLGGLSQPQQSLLSPGSSTAAVTAAGPRAAAAGGGGGDTPSSTFIVGASGASGADEATAQGVGSRMLRTLTGALGMWSKQRGGGPRVAPQTPVAPQAPPSPLAASRPRRRSSVSGASGALARRGSGGLLRLGDPLGERGGFPGADALELRADRLEVETRLVSFRRTNVPELHWLQHWRVMPYDVLVAALGHLPKLAADPGACMRVAFPLLEALLDIMPALEAPPQPPRSGDGAGADADAQPPTPVTFEAQARSPDEVAARRQKLLMAAFRLWVVVFDRLFSVIAPAPSVPMPAVAAAAAAAQRWPSERLPRRAAASFDVRNDTADATATAWDAALSPTPVAPPPREPAIEPTPSVLRGMPHPAAEFAPQAELAVFLSRRMDAPEAHSTLLGIIVGSLEEAAGGAAADAAATAPPSPPPLPSSLSTEPRRAFVVPLRVALQLVRALEAHLRVSIRSFEQHVAAVAPGERGAALARFRTLCSGLLGVALRILARPTDACPPLVVACKAALLRQMPALCLLLTRFLDAAHLGSALVAALQAVSVSDWRSAAVGGGAGSTSTPSAVDAAGLVPSGGSLTVEDLCIPHLVCVFSAVELFLAASPPNGSRSGGRAAAQRAQLSLALYGPVCQALLIHLNGDSVRRVLSIAIVARLAAAVSGPSAADAPAGAPQPASKSHQHSDPQGLLRWQLALVLSELSTAVRDVGADAPAPGSLVAAATALSAAASNSAESDVPDEPLGTTQASPAASPSPQQPGGERHVVQWVSTEMHEVLGRIRALHSRRSAWPGGRRPSAAAAEPAFAAPPSPAAAPPGHLLASPRHSQSPSGAHLVAQLKADCAVLPDHLLRIACAGLSLPLDSASVPRHGPVRHGVGLKQVAVATLVAVVSSVPLRAAPFLFATVAPVRHALPLGAPLSTGLSADDTEAARLALALQLVRAALGALEQAWVPASWTPYLVCVHSFATKVARWVGRMLAACYTEDAASERSGGGGWQAALPLWRATIDLLFALLTSPVAAPELLPPARRSLVLGLCGDRRASLCALVRHVWGGAVEEAGQTPPSLAAPASADDSWGALDPAEYLDASGATATAAQWRSGASAQLQLRRELAPRARLALADQIVAVCLDLTHSPSPEVSGLARDVYLDLIRAEVTAGNAQRAGAVGLGLPRLPLPPISASRAVAGLPIIERLTIDAVDVIVARHGPSLATADAGGDGGETPSETPVLIAALFAPSPQPGSDVSDSVENAALLCHPSVSVFLQEIRILHAMLSSISRFPPTSTFEDERTAAALVLINYLRRSHRTDLYSKYVAFLAELHRQEGNAAEAALSFLRHADVLSWTAEPLPAVRTPLRQIFPAQTAASRLECALVAGVERLAAADCWEEAVALCDVLAQRYERLTGEYSKLAAVGRRRAALVDRIARSERVHPAYFGVFYSGAAFPPDMRGRCFVYRGSRGERIDAFKQRLIAKWPRATFSGLDLSPLVAAASTAGTIAGASTQSAATPELVASTSASGSEDFSLSFAAVNPVASVPLHPLQQYVPAAVAASACDLDDSGAGMSNGTATVATAQGPLVHASVDLQQSSAPAVAQSSSGGLHDLIYGLVARPAAVAGPRASCPVESQGTFSSPALLSAGIRLGNVHAGVRSFSYTRTFRKRATKTSQGFLDLWHSVAYVRVEEPFPCARRRVPVVGVSETVLNPLEAAILALREKNVALRDATERAWAGPDGEAPQSFTAAVQVRLDGEPLTRTRGLYTTPTPPHPFRRASSIPSSRAASRTTAPSSTAPTALRTRRLPKMSTRTAGRRLGPRQRCATRSQSSCGSLHGPCVCTDASARRRCCRCTTSSSAASVTSCAKRLH